MQPRGFSTPTLKDREWGKQGHGRHMVDPGRWGGRPERECTGRNPPVKSSTRTVGRVLMYCLPKGSGHQRDVGKNIPIRTGQLLYLNGHPYGTHNRRRDDLTPHNIPLDPPCRPSPTKSHPDLCTHSEFLSLGSHRHVDEVWTVGVVTSGGGVPDSPPCLTPNHCLSVRILPSNLGPDQIGQKDEGHGVRLRGRVDSRSRSLPGLTG